MENVGLDEKKSQLVAEFYANNAEKLHKMVDKILAKSRFTNFDYMGDFYSLANEVFVKAIGKYDGLQSFNGFLYTLLQNNIKTEVTRLNRYKRKADVGAISLDTPIGDGDITIADTLKADFDMEKELCGSEHSEKITAYLNSLPVLQRKIAECIMQGDRAENIKDKLGLSDKEYKEHWKNMTSYENKRILDNKGGKTMTNESVLEIRNVTETYKNTSYSIDALSKRLRKGQIRDNHILQRHSGQWQRLAKSELISDILRGKSLTQIVICEELRDGIVIQWIIDGKQRCTILDDFLHDGFAISKNVKNYIVQYQATRLDENGKIVTNSEGFPLADVKECDIRGKKFSKLPEELQDIFRDRQIPILYNMNCTKKDLVEDIARFNRGRAMNRSQNGWLGIDEGFGEMVDNIAKMEFFQKTFKGSNYSSGNHTSGNIRRMIVEGVMVSDFIDDFGKNFDKMCEFLSEEAGDTNFTDFYYIVDKLTAVCTEEVADLFGTKNSFLWFGLFSRFIKICDDDTRFIDFLKAFKETLHAKRINGVSFDELNKGSTKDKSVVIAEMDILETLMCDFLGVVKEEKSVGTETDGLTFVQENVSKDITEEDFDLYADCIDDLTLNVDNNTRLMDNANRPSLIAMMAYAFKTEKDDMMEDWIKEFFANHTDYQRNQKENYIYMRKDFDIFCETAA